MKKIHVLFIVSLFFLIPESFSAIRTEKDLHFLLDRQALEKGIVQLATDMNKSESFFSNHTIFQLLDLYRVSELQNDSVIGAKYAFVVDGDIEHFSRENIFKAKEFESISKNVTVYESSVVNQQQISFLVSKRISLYRLQSEVTYTYLDLEKNEDFIDEHQQHYSSIISNAIPEVTASIITIHHTQKFSNFFNKAVNICLYEKLPQHKTLIYCYMTSSVRRSALMTLGLVVNFERSLKEEIIYTIGKIKSLNQESSEEEMIDNSL